MIKDNQNWRRMIIDNAQLKLQYKNENLILYLRMAHYPYLQKQQVYGLIKSQSSENLTRANWKSKINNQILQKYTSIKRQQQQKKINHLNRQKDPQLPYYFIFPTQYNKNSKYTSFMDTIRLERMKNGHNKKYQQKVWPHHNKNRQIQEQNQYYRPYTNSDSYLRGSASGINRHDNTNSISSTVEISRRKQHQQEQINKQNHDKSVKSLSQTNISPSRISRFQKKTIQRQNGLKTNRQTPPTKSQITFNQVKRQYKLQTEFNQSPNKKNRITQTHKYPKFGNKPKTETKQYQNSSEERNRYKKEDQKSPFQQQNNEMHQKNNAKNQISRQNSELNRPDYRQTNKLSSYEQNKIDMKNNAQNNLRMKHPDKKKYDDYGTDDYQSIKQERDYLRQKFIEHLQYRHAKQLPYKVKIEYYEQPKESQKLKIKKTKKRQ